MSEARPPAEQPGELAESTVFALSLGIVLAIIMGAANVYLGLYAGMTVSASIPAAVVSMAILRALRHGTILENNIVQTVASTGESLAAGAIFTIPALVIVGVWQDFKFWPTTFIIMTGGMLGVLFMIPLRRALIVDRTDLTYPEGVACASVLRSGQEGGAGIKWIGVGLLAGALVKFLIGAVGLVQGALEGAISRASSVFYVGGDVSPALIAVGYIVHLRIAAQIFLGGFIAWVVVLPFLGGYESGAAVETAWTVWSTEVRYVGVGAMLVGGLYSIWSVRTGVVSGIMSLRVVGDATSAEARPRTERDMKLSAIGTIFILTLIGTFVLYEFLIGNHFAALIATCIMVVAAFIFVAVATYIVGLVGSSNSPVSGMTICALIVAAAVLFVLGVEGDSAILATLGVAGVVCCATCTAGDVAQDLKTGILVGATPARQQWAEVIGVVIPAFIFAPIMALLHHNYGIGDQLAAPQAVLFASLANGFFGDGELPMNMIYIGAAIGVAIVAADALLQAAKIDFRLYIMPVAVGMYLPFSLAVPILIGGIIRAVFSKTKDASASDNGVLFGSGIIAGEALMGIGLAIPISLGFALGWLEASLAATVVVAIAVVTAYAYVARRTD